jgi:transcriptional/translational regulatory protein YebC/TACO1
MVEGMTDNRNRTAPELRRLFEKNGGQMGASGTAGWAFERMGTIVLDKDAVSEEKLMEVALEAGAEDSRDEGGTWLVCMPVADLFDVLAVFETAEVPVVESGLSYVPNNKKEVAGKEAEQCLSLAEALDDHDDVQGVFFDFDVSDEELSRISGE